MILVCIHCKEGTFNLADSKTLRPTKKNKNKNRALSAVGVEYTDCTHAEE